MRVYFYLFQLYLLPKNLLNTRTRQWCGTRSKIALSSSTLLTALFAFLQYIRAMQPTGTIYASYRHYSRNTIRHAHNWHTLDRKIQQRKVWRRVTENQPVHDTTYDHFPNCCCI